MPGYQTIIDAPTGSKAIARATLRTPGDWDQLTQPEKDAWNKATAAIDELLGLYHNPGQPYCTRCGYPHEPGKCTR